MKISNNMFLLPLWALLQERLFSCKIGGKNNKHKFECMYNKILETAACNQSVKLHNLILAHQKYRIKVGGRCPTFRRSSNLHTIKATAIQNPSYATLLF